MQTYQEQANKKLATTIIAVVIIAGVVIYADHLKARPAGATTTLAPSSSSSSTISSNSTTPSTGSSASGSGSSNLKDGSYTASSDYFVPHGDEIIKVNLTLSGGTITAASVQNSESDPTSAQFQEDFASLYKSFVIGKKISGLQLDTIAGASDTTQGF